MYFKGEVTLRDLIVGTRKSKLALTQTNHVVELLKQKGIGNNIIIKDKSTVGYRKTNVALLIYFKGEVTLRDLNVVTRKSKLALTQTNHVVELLKQKGIGNNIQIKEISTVGDRKTNVALSSFGSQGIFIDDIEEALLSKEIDFAVNSINDFIIKMIDNMIISS